MDDIWNQAEGIPDTRKRPEKEVIGVAKTPPGFERLFRGKGIDPLPKATHPPNENR